MPLSKFNQSKTFKFGGFIAKQIIRPDNFDPVQHLNTIDSEEFHHIFHEWIIQCWIYDYTELIPKTNEGLAKFEIDSLIPVFKDKYVLGDWRNIVEYSGASLDEMGLISQIKSKQKLIYLLNAQKELPPVLPEMIKYGQIDESSLFTVYLNFLKYCGDSRDADLFGVPTLITDGEVFHVFNPVKVDDGGNFIYYYDSIGENGKCFLNKENNRFKIESEFEGNTYRDWFWKVSVLDFKKVFYGIILYQSKIDLWNFFAFKVDHKMILSHL